MPSVDAALVDIVREFFDAHESLRRVIARYRSGELRFSELEDLVWDDERAVLYRLKERCHSLFRAGGDGSDPGVHRGALFDLVVGSLFHEAMSFRENFYQVEVYGPRMRKLRSGAGGEAGALFEEFDRILQALSGRAEDGLRETEALLGQTREQLLQLLSQHPASGQLARYLMEHREPAAAVFGRDLADLLAEIYGDDCSAYTLAGRSYLRSGYYEDAECAFAQAIERGGAAPELESVSEYARGMKAYLAGDYGETIDRLTRWVESGDGARDGAMQSLAHAALTRVGKFCRSDGREALAAAAVRLAEQLAPPRADPLDA